MSTDEAPAEMAAAAGRLALDRAGVAASEIALLMHASMWFQGLSYWTPASYIHREVLGDDGRYAPAIDVQQMCAGAVGAIGLAAPYLAASVLATSDSPASGMDAPGPATSGPDGDADRRYALITTGDRFGEPGFSRFGTDASGLVLADGGSAAVIGPEGFARILSIATVVDTALEGMYRGDEPFATEPGRPVDARARRAAFAAGAHRLEPGVTERTTSRLVEAVGRALDEAGLKLGDIARFVFPNVGLNVLRTRYAEPLGIGLERTAWDWGRRVGHIGAGDQFAGLAHLAGSGQVAPGDHVMLCGIGAGFAWVCSAVEIVARPDWGG